MKPDVKSDDEIVGRVIHAAGPRPPLPDDLKQAARAAWRDKVESYAQERSAARRYGRWPGWAVAAALLLVAGVSALFGSRFGPAPVGDGAVAVATVEGLFGTPSGTLAAGDALSAGAAVETGPGERVALRLAVAAPAGTTVTARADGTLERTAVTSHGAPWDWVLEASPGFELEGRSVSDFLAWVTRETGWRLRYADPELERETAGIIASGSIEGLTPAEAPEVVLPASGLDYRVTDGTLLVARAGSSWD